MSKLLITFTLLSSASLHAAAYAQENAPNITQDEIVITAERREQNIQSVPVSVTALSSKMLETANINSTDALLKLAPGLQYASSGGFPQPFLRGIGNDRASNAEASTATYLDGVYLALSGATIQDLFDVERVEVLRGPQGTLYGRNATGGTINIVTKRPSFDFSGKVRLTAGSHDLFRGQAFVTGPISSTLAASLALTAYRQDSFHHNVSARRPAKFREEEEGRLARGKLLWRPSDNFEAELGADYVEKFAFDDAADRQIQSNATGFGLGGATGTKPYDVAYGQQVGNKLRQHGGFLKTSTDMNFASLVTITGYRLTDTFPKIDLAATDVVGFRADIDTRSRQWSHEVQLVSAKSSDINWIVGAFYFNERQKNDPYRLTIAAPIGGRAVTVNDTLTRVKQVTDAYALYGQATVPVTTTVSLVGGMRYSWEKRDVSDFTVENLLTGVTTPFSGKSKNFKKFTYKVGVDYKPNSDLLFYVSHSRGFKAGIFNLSNPSRDLGPVQPEVVDAYEIGTKWDFADGRARLNISAFHYDLSNLQVTIVAAGSSAAVLRNAASANINGGELELWVRPTNRLQLSATAAILDAKYDSFAAFPALLPAPAPSFGNVAVPTDLSGQRMMRAPKFTGSLDARYTVPLGSGELRIGGSLYYNGGYRFDPAGVARQPKYATVDGSIAYTPGGEGWEVTIWGKNLTDKRYFQRISVYGTGKSANYAPPITGGVTVAMRF